MKTKNTIILFWNPKAWRYLDNRLEDTNVVK